MKNNFFPSDFFLDNFYGCGVGTAKIRVEDNDNVFFNVLAGSFPKRRENFSVINNFSFAV